MTEFPFSVSDDVQIRDQQNIKVTVSGGVKMRARNQKPIFMTFWSMSDTTHVRVAVVKYREFLGQYFEDVDISFDRRSIKCQIDPWGKFWNLRKPQNLNANGIVSHIFPNIVLRGYVLVFKFYVNFVQEDFLVLKMSTKCGVYSDMTQSYDKSPYTENWKIKASIQKTQPETSITQRLWTKLGRSVELPAATELIRLNRCTGFQPSY